MCLLKEIEEEAVFQEPLIYLHSSVGSAEPSYMPVAGWEPLSCILNEALDWDSRRAAAERLLQEAISSWREAREVLAEVKELQARQQRAEHSKTRSPTTPSQNRKKKSP